VNLKMEEFVNLKISDVKFEIYDAMGRATLRLKIATSQEQPFGFRNDSRGMIFYFDALEKSSQADACERIRVIV
jgi:hypothetical protein